MAHLERFLDTATGEGMTFTQELPDACVPILRGEIVRPLGALGG